MQVSVEKKEGLMRVLNITVEANKFSDLFQQRLSKVAKDVKMDGFRPGKVPLAVVQQRYGTSIAQEVAGDLMMSTFTDAAEQGKIIPAGMPSFKINKVNVGEDFEFTATVEIFPEFKLNSLGGQTAERIEASIGEDDVKAVLKRLQEQRAEYVVVDGRPAADKDEVILDFDGYLEDKPLDQGKATEFKLLMGSNTMIPGFEEGIAGKKAGDEFEMFLEFPKEYHHKDVAGKPVHFKIKIHSVAEQKLPELNEAFFEEFKIEDKTLASFQKHIQKDMQRDLTQRLKSLNKKALFDVLLKANPIDTPKPLVEQEINSMVEEAMRSLTQLKDSKKFNFPRDIFREEATRRIQLGLLVQEIIKEQNLKVDDDKLQQEINTMSEAYEDSEEYKRWINQNEKVRSNFEALVLEDMVADWLATQIKVVPIQKKYDEIINRENESE